MMSKNNAGASFMDSIFNSLKELKHERACLAQRLSEQQSQRQALEQELEQEALAVAEKKMDQCIVSSSCIQDEINKQKVTKKSLVDECESENTSTLEYTEKFKSILADVAEDLFQARDSFKETTLMKKISETEKLQQEAELSVGQHDKEIQDLNRSIENLNMEEKLSCSDIDLQDTVNCTIRAIEVDNAESQAHLLQLQSELKGVHEALQSTETAV